jgi:hypothetical protein
LGVVAAGPLIFCWFNLPANPDDGRLCFPGIFAIPFLRFEDNVLKLCLFPSEQ